MLKFLNVPKRESAFTIAQRSVAQYGQNSAPRYTRLRGLPSAVRSGGPGSFFGNTLSSTLCRPCLQVLSGIEVTVFTSYSRCPTRPLMNGVPSAFLSEGNTKRARRHPPRSR